jgi:hypothetical protein
VLVRDLDSDQLNMARQAIDVTVCDSIGSSNLTDVCKHCRHPALAPAIGEAQKPVRFASEIFQAQLMVSDWVPDVAFIQWVSTTMDHGALPRCVFLTLPLLVAPSLRRKL